MDIGCSENCLRAEGGDFSMDGPLFPEFTVDEDALRAERLLVRLLELAALRSHRLAALARRRGAPGRVLAAMAEDCRRDFRRLAVLRFLISGQPYCTKGSVPPLPRSTALALRGCWLDAAVWQKVCESAAFSCSEPRLQALFLSLSRRGAGHARALCTLLEQRCPPP